ncbi:hypothetical protein [Chondromyces apiculatus]|uniref:Uncharacterized protein n=1 Tax=Chondromyces apiculatus DSM 436 TaxID=1192034 RepID=A0A017SUP9_9BACT|nr:hypothetical protein [Chondromyces apiculatus]EYF00694.1 Hypothetical protein CAP_0326 [Chondromyces apiculatus DSM 436]
MPSLPSRYLGRAARALARAALPALLIAPACTSLFENDPPPADVPEGPELAPGEVCVTPAPPSVRVRFEPSFIALAPCGNPSGAPCERTVNVVVDPDVCTSTPVTFQSADASVVAPPAEGNVGLRQPTLSVVVRAGARGESTITALVPRGDGSNATAELTVAVLPGERTACTGEASSPLLNAGDTLRGEGGLAGATLTLPEGADHPNQGSFIWSVAPFPAALHCAADLDLPGHLPLGPAITFGPEDKKLPREIPFSVPLNPALIPAQARLRHIRLAYAGPGFHDPRPVPIADPRIEQIDGQWALTFKAPRLGTYQAFVRADGGVTSRKRRLSHRAIMGISMGGGGSAMVGLRNHHLFDVVAPLGGPVDWTWLLHHIEQNHLGGFRPIASGTTLNDIELTAAACTTSADCEPDETCLGPEGVGPGHCAFLPVPGTPYEHPSTFNRWWYEYPREGNGGSFDRNDYIQIFRDLALMFGNPNGENLSEGAESLPAGVPPDDRSVIGDSGECSVWVEPLDDHPNREHQEQLKQQCPTERCSHTLTLTGYFDDEYNPDGTFPVITVCDGSPQNQSLTPYANTWSAEGNGYPLELALAVDYNGNGVRDEMEPLIRAGREPFQDTGEDGLPSALEPGYEPLVNEDPAGDDYDPQYNPTGTEGDHRYQQGEPFDDVGLDGVPGTTQQPPGGWRNPGDGFDVGEADGAFTVSSGLQRVWDVDPHSVVRGWSTAIPGGPLDDVALSRLDLWTDGGTRDLFNFMADAQHLVGTFAARGRDVAYLTDFGLAPGLEATTPDQYAPGRIVWEDLQGVVLQRYGKADPTPADIESGSGQHVGTGAEIIARLQAALYFAGSRWPEPHLRRLVAPSADKPAEGLDRCEINGTCIFDFTSTFGRMGPVAVNLPPGYGHADLQDRRYPVIYLMHGYGQEPQDLAAAGLILQAFMNDGQVSEKTRLPKAIVVYVDGRCRENAAGKAECLQGTFYGDSARPDGPQMEQWLLELMDHIDQRYRTLGETETSWTQ